MFEPINAACIPLVNSSILVELLQILTSKGVMSEQEVHDLLDRCAERHEAAASNSTTDFNAEGARYIRALMGTSV